VHEFFFVREMPHSIDVIGSMGPVYSLRNSDGREITRDTFGCLLGDAPIPERWNDDTIEALLRRYPSAKERLQAENFWVDDERDVESYISFLGQLQTIHDSGTRAKLTLGMKVMFRQQGVKWPTTTK